MGWEDLRELVNLGFEIGSHTVSHSRLSLIDDDINLRFEIISSKEQLEEKLGVECRYFSWPYGGVGDISARSLEIIKDAGYVLNFGGYRGSINGDTQVHQVPRHHFEPSWPLSHVEYFARGNYEKT
jgi:peptidoglycan/xylan/chitin deacetylase (PgdA/CDA1 family)